MQTKINLEPIKEYMLVEGLTQYALANLAHLNPASVSRLFTTNYCTPRTVKRIAGLLSCDVRTLLKT